MNSMYQLLLFVSELNFQVQIRLYRGSVLLFSSLFICIENEVNQRTYLLQTSRNVLEKASPGNSRTFISKMMLSLVSTVVFLLFNLH